MIKKEEKPKETIVEPIFEEILPGVMAAPPELVEAFAPELAPEVALPAERFVVPLAPARPHYYGLRGEMFSTPCTARSLFIYLFRFLIRVLIFLIG